MATQGVNTEAQRAARNAGALAAASLFSKGMLFIWQFILARWIGEAGYGIYGTVGALATIATVMGSFGMGLIVVRDVSRQPSLAGKYLTATLYMQTLLVLGAFLVMNLAAYGIGYSAEIRVYTALSGIGLIIDIFGNMCSDQLLAKERMVTTSLIEALHIALRIGLVALALWLGWGLLGLYVLGMVAGAARSVMFGAALARAGVLPAFPLDRQIAVPLFVNSTPLAVAAILTLAYQQADKLISTRLLDESSTGYLTAAYVVIMGVIELLNSTVLIATYPMMSRYYQDGQALFGVIVEKLIFFTLILTLPIGLTLTLYAEQLTVPLFGTDFLPSANILRVLIWYALIAMLVNVFAQGMMVQNKQRRLLWVRVGGLSLNLTLNIVLITQFQLGVMGLVIASVVAEGIVLLILLGLFRQSGVDNARLVIRALRPLMLAAGVGLLMAWASRLHWGAGLALGALGYALGLLFGGVLARDDWDLLYRLVAAMPCGGFILRYWQNPPTP